MKEYLKKNKNKFISKPFIISSVGIFLIVVFVFIQYVISELPSVEQLESPEQELSSNVFSEDGKIIGQFFIQNRVETELDSIPPIVIQALIATEDRKFYDHWGVDAQRFVQAMIKSLFLGKKEGGSTVTQQLAKNLYSFKTSDESLFETGIRKIREWITAVQIEKNYTKHEILAMYFNNSYFGNGAYGIEMASAAYFNKKPMELNIPEAALLIAQLKSPAYYNPVTHFEAATNRRNLILHNMFVVDFITEAEYERFIKQPIKISMEKIKRGFKSEFAPHFVELIRQNVSKLAKSNDLNLYKDGLNIHTTLDSKMQQFAREAVDEHLNEFQKQFDKSWNWKYHQELYNTILDEEIKKTSEYRSGKNKQEKTKIYHSLKNNKNFVDSLMKPKTKIQVSLIAIDQRTGKIKALIGGRDNNDYYGLNRATQIKRHPGSSFKPIIYATAIENGLYPAYPILNQKFDYNGWSPSNYSNDVGGFMTLRDGLKLSKNIVAARLIVEGHVELWQIGNLARRLGITSKLELYPAISLGATEVTPLEMVNVFSTFANHGIYVEPFSIDRVTDKNGIILTQNSPKTREALSETNNYIITNMLESVIESGTGAGIRSKFQFFETSAGKTGTTQNWADAWFIGFTKDIVAGVWVGFDDHRITLEVVRGDGAKSALPIWALFMKKLYNEFKFTNSGSNFVMPSNGSVIYADFCIESIYEYGNPKLSSGDCTQGVITDLIKAVDLPQPFNAAEDTEVKIDPNLLPKNKESSDNPEEN